MVNSESFWTVVYPAFIDRELTKTDLRQLIKAGLQRTQGSYRKPVELFRMTPGDTSASWRSYTSTIATSRFTGSVNRGARNRRPCVRRADRAPARLPLSARVPVHTYGKANRRLRANDDRPPPFALVRAATKPIGSLFKQAELERRVNGDCPRRGAASAIPTAAP
jgi:hypothetical protein